MNVFGFLSTLVIVFASANVPEQWLLLNSKCIYISDRYASFDDSQQACVNKSASLVIMKSESETDAIIKLFPKIGRNYWIGYTKTSNGWQWLDSSTNFQPTLWNDHGTGPSAFLSYYNSTTWRMYSYPKNSVTMHYICEKRRWRKLNANERAEMCGVEFMPNCDGLSCDSVCLRHPGCSSYAIWSNTCVNLKNRAEAGGNCVVKLSLNADEYTSECN